MKNGVEQYQEIKKNDDVFAIAENNFKAQATDQDSDCWGNLWQCIKVKISRFSSASLNKLLIVRWAQYPLDFDKKNYKELILRGTRHKINSQKEGI